eukprot:TRINITY_DN10491_c0_g1_i1.p1 TRINITY_DN10491_c0_g1~~TRINITY_DN10491_c0_g1_i1.p1  ORF type:complete len:735 (-),score=338.73 TRINITY_DN10491_c0_g1_i1:356-2560(-)
MLEAFTAEADKAAAKRVADLLSVPEQLTTVEATRNSISRKCSALEANLKTIVQTQIEEAKEALSTLKKSVDLTVGIRDDFKHIDELCRDCKELIGDYDIIKGVNRARLNLLQTLKELERLLRIPQQMARIKALLEHDINILEAYTQIRGMQQLQKTSFQVANATQAEIDILERIFEALDDLVRKFEAKLFTLSKQCIDLCQKHPAVMVKVVQVIEKEERCDQLIKAEMIAKGLNPQASENTSQLQLYRELFFQHVKTSVYERFQARIPNFEELDAGGEPAAADEALKAASQLLDDLTVVLDDVVPVFPDSYGMFVFYVREYHLQFNNMLQSYATHSTKISPQEMLQLVNWVKREYTPQLKRLGVSDLKPDLLDTLDPLYDAYRNRIRGLLEKAVEGIIQQDREKRPEVVDGRYITLAPSLLFEYVNTQMSIARDTADSKFLYSVVRECSNAMILYQQALSEMLKADWEEIELESVIAIVNNNADRSYDQVQVMVQKIASMLDEPYSTQVVTLFEPVEGGFHDVAKRAVRVIADIIFRDMKEALDKLFSKEWYEGTIVGSVVMTLQEFFKDEIKGYMLDSYFRKLADDCLERIVNTYVEQLFTKKQPLGPATAQRMQDDQVLLSRFFGEHCGKRAARQLQILIDLHDVIESEPEMISLYFNSLVKNNPDCTLTIMQALLSLRTDLDKAQKEEALDGCRAVLANGVAYDREHKDGVFSRIKLASRIGGIFSGLVSK